MAIVGVTYNIVTLTGAEKVAASEPIAMEAPRNLTIEPNMKPPNYESRKPPTSAYPERTKEARDRNLEQAKRYYPMEVAPTPVPGSTVAGDETSGMLGEMDHIVGEVEHEVAHEESLLAQLDINNVFNKVWGLLQGIILAWVGVKIGRRNK